MVPEYQCAVKREAKKAQKEKERPGSSSLGSPATEMMMMKEASPSETSSSSIPSGSATSTTGGHHHNNKVNSAIQQQQQQYQQVHVIEFFTFSLKFEIFFIIFVNFGFQILKNFYFLNLEIVNFGFPTS